MTVHKAKGLERPIVVVADLWRGGERPDSTPVVLHPQVGPVLKGEAEGVRDFAVTALHGVQWAIRTAEWTYILDVRGDEPPELFDRRTDRTEQADVLAGNRAEGERLEQKLRAFAKEMTDA